MFSDNKTHWYDHSRDWWEKKLGWVRLGVRVPSFHDFGNLGGQLKTRYDDTFGQKRKRDTINAPLHYYLSITFKDATQINLPQPGLVTPIFHFCVSIP